MTAVPLDQLNRPLHDLRVSVTDRCNFRCTYCMPREVFGAGYDFLPKDALLTFEEITRLARVFVSLGVEKVRLTGGEPLLRRNLDRLIAQLADIDGLRDLTLTTNGSALVEQAAALRAAGLRRLTVSVDSLDDATFRAMNDVDFPLHRVLRGLDAARVAGFAPIKINCVVRRGVNEADIVQLARHFSGPEFIVRFIEYMAVGTTNHWNLADVVTAAEIIARLGDGLPLEALPPNYRGEVARRFRAPAGGEIGVIASVTAPFCRDCTRARLTADGHLFTCLFGTHGHDLRTPLRTGASDAELRALIGKLWQARTDRYSGAPHPRDPARTESRDECHRWMTLGLAAWSSLADPGSAGQPQHIVGIFGAPPQIALAPSHDRRHPARRSHSEPDTRTRYAHVSQVARTLRLQFLRPDNRPRIPSRGNRGGRAERVWQIQRARRHPLGARRAIGQGAAWRQMADVIFRTDSRAAVGMAG